MNVAGNVVGLNTNAVFDGHVMALPVKDVNRELGRVKKRLAGKLL